MIPRVFTGSRDELSEKGTTRSLTSEPLPFFFSYFFVFQDITYKIINYTNDGIAQNKQQQIFRNALNLWQSASRLRFTEVDSDDADILVSFVTKTHGDRYPFDGEGGTLAHAFYPHNNKGKEVFLNADYPGEGARDVC